MSTTRATKYSHYVRWIATAAALLLSSFNQIAIAQEGTPTFAGWHLEPALGQAHLVMVARVASISRVTVIKGAKTEVTLREYRFQPIRRLKGLFFQREQLSMTASDLGLPADDESLPPQLKEGEFRLLILVQQQNGSMGCVSAAPNATTFGERVPLLNGPDDPLVSVAETLIRSADSRSRQERAKLLVEALQEADGISAVPLLSSLRLRADWASADDRAYSVLAKLARSQQPAVRLGALEVLREMLASANRPKDEPLLQTIAEVQRSVLDSDESSTNIRLAALEGLGRLLMIKPDLSWAGDLLIKQSALAATNAERTMAIWALARIPSDRSAKTVLDAFRELPLDEDTKREQAYARAAVRLDTAAAERLLVARLKTSMAAGQSLEVEIQLLGRIRSKDSLPIFLEAAQSSRLTASDRSSIAWALGRLGGDRGVPVLIEWLRSNDFSTKEAALTALETIDSDLAAREARPLLKPEANLQYKLRIARLLARHRLADGYALATEHLADNDQTPAAALVLGALNDPRTANDLSAIIAARPDRRWHGAALVGLVAVGDSGAVAQLRDILTNDRNALASEAAEAAGLSTDRDLLVPLATLARSRNQPIAMASLTAIRRFLSGVRAAPRGLAVAPNASAMANNELSTLNLVSWNANFPAWGTPARQSGGPSDDDDDRPAAAVEIPADTQNAILEAVGALVVDSYVDASVRLEALAIARLLGGQRYAALLTTLADQAESEGSPLLAQVQVDRRRLIRDGAKP